MDTGERRKHRRIGQEVEVTLRLISFPLDASMSVAVEMTDVSEGGVGLNSPASFPEGASVEVSMKLPGWFSHTSTMTRYREEDRPLMAVGRVIRCLSTEGGGYDVGVEFTDIWEDHWRAMRQHLGRIIDKER